MKNRYFEKQIHWVPLNLQNSLNNARRWLTSNQMVPNAKKTKQLLIASRQKLQNVNQLTLDLYVNGVTEGFSTFERFEHSTGTSVLVQNIIAKAIRKPKRKVARLYQAKTLKAKTLKIIKFKRHYSKNPIEIKDYLLLEFTS